MGFIPTLNLFVNTCINILFLELQFNQIKFLKEYAMLDKINKKILAALQEDGRITNVDLATKVNLSPAACLERVRRLTDMGYIVGYTALLNP